MYQSYLHDRRDYETADMADYSEDYEREPECSRLLEKVVTARKARNVRAVQSPEEIRPGDRVRITSYFTFRPNGPRLRYFHLYERISKGPNW